MIKTRYLIILFLVGCSNVDETINKVYQTIINDASIYYRIITVNRDKPYIFFLHGGPGGNSMYSEHLFPSITDNKFNWVFMDQRGSGRSSVYHKDPAKSDLLKSQVTPTLMLEDIEFIRKKHKLGKVIIYGHSWGGNLAAHYVDKYPNSLLGYIIASTSHEYKKDSFDLRETYLEKTPLLKMVLKDILENGYTNKHQLYKSELKRLFDGQGYSELLFELTQEIEQNGKINQIINNLNKVEQKLINMKLEPFNGQVVFNILRSIAELGAYNQPMTPAIELGKLPLHSDIKQNTLNELFGGLIIEDNVTLYPNFKVKGVFWCGLYDIWDESTMIKASQLASNSISFVFPRSGHHYFKSEPSLFKIKLQESLNYIMDAPIKADEQQLEKYLGNYEHYGFGELVLILENKKLIANLKGIRIQLVPIADSQFLMKGGPGSGGKINFLFAENGDVKSLSAQGYTFKCIPNEIE